MAGAFELPYALEHCIRTTEVKVVQQVNAEALTATLKWIVDRLPKGDAPGGADLTGLQVENQALTQRLNELEAKQADLEAQLNGLKDATPAGDNGLEARVQALEDAAAGQQTHSPAGTESTAAPAGDGGRPTSPTAAAAGAAAVDPAALQELQERVAALEAAQQQGGPVAATSEAAAAGPVQGGDDSTLDALSKVLGELQALKQHVQQLEQQQQQGGGGGGSAEQAKPATDDLSGLASDLSARLEQLEASSATDQLMAMLQDLAGRLASLELRVEMNVGSAEQPSQAAQAEAAAGHAAVSNASSLDDALLIIRELYDKLSNKADRTSLDPLIRRAADMTTAIGDLTSRLSALESQPRSAPAPTAPTTLTTTGADSPVNRVAPLENAMGRVFDLETSVSSLAQQLEAAVGELQQGQQQQGQQLDQLAAQLAGKAEQAALDRLAVQAAVAAAGGGGADADALTDMLSGIVADKASKAEVGLLASQVAAKPSREELQTVAQTAQQAGQTAQAAMERATDAALASSEATAAAAAAASGGGSRLGTPAAAAAAPAAASAAAGVTRDELEQLAQQLGDMFADLAHLRAQLAAQQAAGGAGAAATAAGGDPAGAAAAAALAVGGDGSGGGGEAVGKMVAALAREVATLKEALDWVAHASCIISVGLEPQRLLPAAGGGAGANGAPPGLSGGKEPRNQRGALDRLVKLLGRQSVVHKMDWFEPDTLNQMSQKLGMVEALLHNPQMMGRGAPGPQGPDVGLKDLEAQLRRLSKDVRLLKDTQVAAGGLPRGPDSDHAMLSGKPLMGYRCMACDRPLDKLHEKPGPYIPSHQMPVRLPTAPDAATKAAMMRAPVVGPGMVSPENSNVGTKFKKAVYEPGQRGPQTWYEDAKGLPADALPSGDVGPKLPPGGWRSSVSGGAYPAHPVQACLICLAPAWASAVAPRPPAAGQAHDTRGGGTGPRAAADEHAAQPVRPPSQPASQPASLTGSGHSLTGSQLASPPGSLPITHTLERS